MFCQSLKNYILFFHDAMSSLINTISSPIAPIMVKVFSLLEPVFDEVWGTRQKNTERICIYPKAS
jgi:hypothetical protein